MSLEDIGCFAETMEVYEWAYARLQQTEDPMERHELFMAIALAGEANKSFQEIPGSEGWQVPAVVFQTHEEVLRRGLVQKELVEVNELIRNEMWSRVPEEERNRVVAMVDEQLQGMRLIAQAESPTQETGDALPEEHEPDVRG